MPFEQALRILVRLADVTYARERGVYVIRPRALMGGGPPPGAVGENPITVEKVPVQYLRSSVVAAQIAPLPGGLVALEPLPRENALIARGTIDGINELKQLLRLVDVPAKPLRLTVGIRAPGVGRQPLSIRSTAHSFVGDELMTEERGSVGGHATHIKVRVRTHIQGTGELEVATDWDVSVPVAGGTRGPVRLVKRLTATTRLRPGKETPVAMVDLSSWGGKGTLLLWIEGAWR